MVVLSINLYKTNVMIISWHRVPSSAVIVYSVFAQPLQVTCRELANSPAVVLMEVDNLTTRSCTVFTCSCYEKDTSQTGLVKTAAVSGSCVVHV